MNYFVMLLLSLLLVYPQGQSLADAPAQKDCSCQQIPWQQSFDRAEHVLFGEVKEVVRHSDDLATGEFTVMEVFKGDETYVHKVVGSAVQGVSCRRVLLPGYYIVYSIDKHNVVMNPCDATRRLEDDLVSTLAQIKHYADAKQGSSQQPGMPAGKEGDRDSKSWIQMLIDWFG